MSWRRLSWRMSATQDQRAGCSPNERVAFDPRNPRMSAAALATAFKPGIFRPCRMTASPWAFETGEQVWHVKPRGHANRRRYIACRPRNLAGRGRNAFATAVFRQRGPMSLDNHSRTLVLRARNIDKQFILWEGPLLVSRPAVAAAATRMKAGSADRQIFRIYNMPEAAPPGFGRFRTSSWLGTPHLGKLPVPRPGTGLA